MTPNRKQEKPASGKKSVRADQIVVFGVVQGVGFRPFIFRKAKELGLKGWVQNAGFGVAIHIEGKDESADAFLTSLKKAPPPLVQIERIDRKPSSVKGFRGFTIRKTREGESFVFISPDISTCQECHEEIRNPGERRYVYPFTNCTNCGPRYTIVHSLPYDRPQTTMAGFPMCLDCSREYNDPRDRRHHAQPIACPVCGPRVTLKKGGSRRIIQGGIPEAARLIKKGNILAVKGLGGFHLVCDPFSPRAVTRLRSIKARRVKPLALMARNIGVVKRFAEIDAAEKQLLLGPRRPIVLLKKKNDLPLIAPYLDEMGFMLPYTPLHYLLLQDIELIVATSSNSKDAPIMKDEEEGIRDLCDFILTHDRPIAMRADDSVVKIVAGEPLFVRRARGFVPYPQSVPEDLRSNSPLLALGGELKATVSVYKKGYVVTSQFLGDLDDYRNVGYFEETVRHLQHLFDIKPEAVISDLHPDFRTTRFAEKMGIPHFQVQHHFAHILAPMLEHGYPTGKKVLGVAFDGYGYGDDGTAWGGEFLLADYHDYKRMAYFTPVPLPGGDLAARQPWRMALAYLYTCFGSIMPNLPALENIDAGKRDMILQMIEKGIRSPLTSSCGRLFDAVSYLLGTSPQAMEFEAEAAMRLEAAADPGILDSYPYSISKDGPPYVISFSPLFEQMLKDLEHRESVSRISGRFHNTLVAVIKHLALLARKKYGIDTVVLGGGVFLNIKLLEKTMEMLKRNRFRILKPRLYSPNDESLSLGQIAFGLQRLKGSED